MRCGKLLPLLKKRECPPLPPPPLSLRTGNWPSSFFFFRAFVHDRSPHLFSFQGDRENPFFSPTCFKTTSNSNSSFPFLGVGGFSRLVKLFNKISPLCRPPFFSHPFHKNSLPPPLFPLFKSVFPPSRARRQSFPAYPFLIHLCDPFRPISGIFFLFFCNRLSPLCLRSVPHWRDGRSTFPLFWTM